MVEQYRSEKKLADVLLVYGYHHETETFHQDTVRELQKKNIPNVRYVKYDWKRPDGNRRNVCLAFNKFVKPHLPVDYVIDLHDAPNLEDIGDEKIPYFFYYYNSHVKETKELNMDMKVLNDYLEEFSGREVTSFGRLYPDDYAPDYPYYAVELFSNSTTLDEAVMQMEGFISVLQRHPQKVRKVKPSF